MGRLLVDLHAAVRKALAASPLDSASDQPPKTNPKGDLTRPFDFTAERRVVSFLRQEAPESLLLSEESGVLAIGHGPPTQRFILDPVDGSDNYARGLGPSAVCVAVLPVEGPLAPASVEWALVGELDNAMPLLAHRGRGVYRGDTRVRTSAVTRIEEAMISVELNHYAPTAELGSLMAQTRGVRCLGCASRALSLVATGALDAQRQGAPYSAYAFAAQIAEVEVDVELGTVRVRHLVAAQDVGRALNPTLLEGQIQGAVAQGIGFALMEEYVPAKTENLRDYLIPTVGDVPEIEVILIEKPTRHGPPGPFGAKGAGEAALIPTAPAILGAIRHASGARLRRLPALPHRVLEAIHAAGGSGTSDNRPKSSPLNQPSA